MYKPIINKRSVLKFTHFINKGYALFACLGREVIIGVLSVATLQSATAVSISMQTDKITTDTTTTGRSLLLREVSVVGTRAPLTQRQQARMVSVLTREDIQGAPVQSVNDLLKQAVGVDVRQRGPLGAQTDVSIRGSNNEQIAILLNGINICDPQTGHNTFDFPVDIADIERIEVLEGPAGRAYGTSSLLGAINIVTKSSFRPTLSVHLEGGSYGYLSAGARTGWGQSQRWGHSLSGSYTRSDGYRRSKAGHLNADYSGVKSFYHGNYVGDDVTVRWHAGLSSKSWGSNTFYGANWDEQFEHTFKTFTAIQAETTRGKVHLHPSVYWNHNEDRFELFRASPDKYPFNYHRTDIYGLSLNSWFDWQLGRTAIGAELRNEDLLSGNLGEPLERRHHIHGTSRYYEYGLNRTNISFTLEHNIILSRLTASVGLTAVKNSWADMPMRVYPGIDISYLFGSDWKLFASYNTSLRMPSATELYYSVGGHKADKHLKPEELSAIEAGVKYQNAVVDGKLSLFYNHHKNLIDWIRHTADGADAPWQSVNFGEINAPGIATAVAVNLQQLLPQQHILRKVGVAWCYIHQDQQEASGIQSRYALEYLRNKFTADMQTTLWRQLTLGVYYRLQHRTGSYTDTNGQPCSYATYGIVDARLAWEGEKYKFFLSANNLTDRQYVDYGNVPQPGFWLTLGGSITL